MVVCSKLAKLMSMEMGNPIQLHGRLTSGKVGNRDYWKKKAKWAKYVFEF